MLYWKNVTLKQIHEKVIFLTMTFFMWRFYHTPHIYYLLYIFSFKSLPLLSEQSNVYPYEIKLSIWSSRRTQKSTPSKFKNLLNKGKYLNWPSLIFHRAYKMCTKCLCNSWQTKKTRCSSAELQMTDHRSKHVAYNILKYWMNCLIFQNIWLCLKAPAREFYFKRVGICPNYIYTF